MITHGLNLFRRFVSGRDLRAPASALKAISCRIAFSNKGGSRRIGTSRSNSAASASESAWVINRRGTSPNAAVLETRFGLNASFEAIMGAWLTTSRGVVTMPVM